MPDPTGLRRHAQPGGLLNSGGIKKAEVNGLGIGRDQGKVDTARLKPGAKLLHMAWLQHVGAAFPLETLALWRGARRVAAFIAIGKAVGRFGGQCG